MTELVYSVAALYTTDPSAWY